MIQVSHLNGIKVSTSAWSQLIEILSNFEENVFFLMWSVYNRSWNQVWACSQSCELYLGQIRCFTEHKNYLLLKGHKA